MHAGSFLTDGDGDVSAQRKPHQPLRLLGHDDGEAVVAGLVDDRLQLRHAQIILRQYRQRWVTTPRPHHLTRQCCVRELLLGVQEGVAIEANVRLIDALAAERVTHPLAGHDSCHQRHDVLQAAGQLEHDDHQGDCHAGHAACGGERGRDSWISTMLVWPCWFVGCGNGMQN